jgi:hypothetical protein
MNRAYVEMMGRYRPRTVIGVNELPSPGLADDEPDGCYPKLTLQRLNKDVPWRLFNAFRLNFALELFRQDNELPGM